MRNDLREKCINSGKSSLYQPTIKDCSIFKEAEGLHSAFWKVIIKSEDYEMSTERGDMVSLCCRNKQFLTENSTERLCCKIMRYSKFSEHISMKFYHQFTCSKRIHQTQLMQGQILLHKLILSTVFLRSTNQIICLIRRYRFPGKEWVES